MEQKNQINNSTNFIFLAIFLSIGIFIMDLITPLGVADGVLYVSVVLLSLGIKSRQFPLLAAISCSVLTILGYFLSPPMEAFWIVFTNRFISLFGIWIAYGIILMFKKTEEQSVKERESLAALFEFATEGLMITDSRGQIVRVNPMADKMFGYDVGELVGKKVEILIPEKFGSKHIQHRENYMKNPHARAMGKNMELFAKQKNGKEFPVEISLSYYKINNEMLVVAFIIDITERKAQTDAIKIAEEKLRGYALQLKSSNEELEKRVEFRTKELKDSYKILEHINKKLKIEITDKEKAQKDLQESQQLFSAIAKNFPNGTIVVLDHEMKYIFAEGKEFDELGIDKDNLIGNDFLSLLKPESAAPVRAELLKVFKGENVFIETDFKNRNYLLYAVPLEGTEDNKNRILVVSENITDRKKAEEEIRNALEKEKELSELKSRFVSMASHEFRTPLSTILSSNSLIEKYIEAGDIEKQVKHIHRIKSSVKHLTQILNDLLSLSKLEEGKITVKPELFDIRIFGEELTHELQSLAKHGQKIHYSFSGNPSLVFLDKQLLRNIFTNILSNAIKYSDENKNIYSSIVCENDYAYIYVKDEGIGMSEEDQKHLFERFFRGENAANIQGTGLGLNIIKKYLDLMNGEIYFTSKLEQGTTVKIKIPHENNSID